MIKLTKTEKAFLLYLFNQENHQTDKSITQVSIEIDRSLVICYKASAKLQDIGLIKWSRIIKKEKGNYKRKQIISLTSQGVEAVVEGLC